MNRRLLTLLVALVPLLVLVVLGGTVEVPFVALGPGPTFNTLDQAKDKDGNLVDVVSITGDVQQQHPTGNLNMTTVSVRSGLSVFDAIGLWFDNSEGIVPRSEVYPPGKSRTEIDEANKADFRQSEDSAEVAALHYLNYPFDVSVGSVVADGPANQALKAGDQLVSVDGTDVKSSCTFTKSIGAAKPSSTAVVRYRRGGVEETAPITLGARPGDAGKAYVGIGVTEKPTVPFKITFNLSDVGGPSAGLMFTLAVIDKLSPANLTGGKFIAGTGTISDCGDVGPIGGIQYKMAAARAAGAVTFLVPAANCTEARAHTPDGLRLIKVTNVSDAVSSLQAVRDGKPAPDCS